MGAFDDITSQYGKTQNQGNAFEDITSTYGYEVGNAPQPTFIDGFRCPLKSLSLKHFPGVGRHGFDCRLSRAEYAV